MREILFKKRIPGKSMPEKEYTQEGLFHCWGTSFVEFESGPGNFTVAIVELPNGEVVEIEASGIKFIDPA